MPLALVTGATSRLGEVIALHLANSGFDVVLHANKSLAKGERTLKKIRDAGKSAVIAPCDFSNSQRIADFYSGIVAQHGAPELIVNNASVFEYDFPGKAAIETLDRSLEIHVKAPFILTEAAYNSATAENPVTVVNILDQKVVNLNPDYFSYTIGKSSLFALTKLWQMAPSNRIRVFGILPGLLFPSGRQTTDDFERVKSDTPLGRNPSPQEIANTIVLLFQNKSMPGQNIVIDGGESLVPRARDIAYE